MHKKRKKQAVCAFICGGVALIIGAAVVVWRLFAPAGLSLYEERPGASVETATVPDGQTAADEQGRYWISDTSYQVFWGDFDGNGVLEYVTVDTKLPDSENTCAFTLYWNEEPIYTSEEELRIDPGAPAYTDLDLDGKEELFFPYYPWTNSMPLTKFVVLKQTEDGWATLETPKSDIHADSAFPLEIKKGAGEWEAQISCPGLEKQVSVNLETHYQQEPYESYRQQFADLSSGEACGQVASWGIWMISAETWENIPCLKAVHGINGFDSTDYWGEASVYFHYDADGKVQVLDMGFTLHL